MLVRVGTLAAESLFVSSATGRTGRVIGPVVTLGDQGREDAVAVRIGGRVLEVHPGVLVREVYH